jgi:hypothetical protein
MAIDDEYVDLDNLSKASVDDLEPGDYFVSGGRVIEYAGKEEYRAHFNVIGKDGRTYSMWNVDAYYKKE